MAWRYVIRAGMLGRSYTQAWAVRLLLLVGVMGGGVRGKQGGELGVVSGGSSRVGVGGGMMVARQRRAPKGSWMAWRMVLP